MKTFKKLVGLISLSLLCSQAWAGDEKLIENPSNGLLKDSFVVSYTVDDFSDEVEDANILYIPKGYRQQAAFFFRCRPFFTNFSVQFLEQENNLKDDDGELANASKKFAKHGYIYDTKHDLEIITEGDSESMDISVGGQNIHLSKLFKTDIEKSSGLLGMSFHFTFNYIEMPKFRKASNSSEAEDAFELLNRAFKQQSPLVFELDGRNAEDRTFTLDIPRMQNFVPEEVIDFCISKRQLND
ncbi:MAG: hypothetical protein U9R28_06395 [Pseudomonadota bacterium]|nr:hypothetical protein [Pseudomonadota bacterium]